MSGQTYKGCPAEMLCQERSRGWIHGGIVDLVLESEKFMVRFAAAFTGSWLASRSKMYSTVTVQSVGFVQQRLSARWLPETAAMMSRSDRESSSAGTRLSCQPNARSDPNLKLKFMLSRLFSARKFMMQRQPPLEHGTDTSICIVHKTISAFADSCRACR